MTGVRLVLFARHGVPCELDEGQPSRTKCGKPIGTEAQEITEVQAIVFCGDRLAWLSARRRAANWSEAHGKTVANYDEALLSVLEPLDQTRKAAELLRERASKATPGPWTSYPIDDGTTVYLEQREPAGGHTIAEMSTCAGTWPDEPEHEPDNRVADAAYLSSVHPLVGLAVADLLDALRAEFVQEPRAWAGTDAESAALAVARAILGERVP